MTNNWPDPARPGVPLKPEQDGWHWLVQAGHEMPAMWNAAQQQWSQGGLCCSGSCSPKYVASDTFIPRVRYLGPCLTPAEVEARVAEARRAAPGKNAPLGQCPTDTKKIEAAFTALIEKKDE